MEGVVKEEAAASSHAVPDERDTAVHEPLREGWQVCRLLHDAGVTGVESLFSKVSSYFWRYIIPLKCK